MIVVVRGREGAELFKWQAVGVCMGVELFMHQSTLDCTSTSYGNHRPADDVSAYP